MEYYDKFTKYDTIDNKIVLDAEDDAATVNWGNGWRMPTMEEYKELWDKCNMSIATDTETGMTGLVCYACDGSDNYIFIPYMGWYGSKSTNDVASKRKEWNQYFYHWTKDLATQITKDSTGDGKEKTGGYVWQLNDEGTKAERVGWDLSSLGWMVCLTNRYYEWPNGYDRCFGFKVRPVKDK